MKNFQGLNTRMACMTQDQGQTKINDETMLLSPSFQKDKHQNDCEKIYAMLQKEKCYSCHNYLKFFGTDDYHDSSQDQLAADISTRSKICEWMFKIVDFQPEFQRETAIMAMSYLDRYMCSNVFLGMKAKTLDIQDYSLAAMACIYIALKMTGVHIDATSICEMSGLHSREELLSSEMLVLSSLRWKLNGPTALQFVHYMLKLIPASFRSLVPKIHEHCRLQTELAVGNYAMVGLNRSTIAVASILNSITQVDVPLHRRIKFMHEISDVFGIDVESPLVYAARGMLLDSLAIVQAEGFVAQEVPIETDLSQQNDLIHA